MEELEKKIKESYIDYIQVHKKRPKNIEELMAKTDSDAAAFYEVFHSFQELEKLIWKDFIDITLTSIQSGEEYMAFPVKDKLQVFYYTLFNVIQPYRDFVIFCFDDAPFWEVVPSSLSLFQEKFGFFAQDLVSEGIESDEIASRPFLSDHYPKVLWGQTLLILKTWVKDLSDDFDRSDAAVEKSTSFAFDLLERGLFDSGFDLAKFLFSKP